MREGCTGSDRSCAVISQLMLRPLFAPRTTHPHFVRDANQRCGKLLISSTVFKQETPFASIVKNFLEIHFRFSIVFYFSTFSSKKCASIRIYKEIIEFHTFWDNECRLTRFGNTHWQEQVFSDWSDNNLQKILITQLNWAGVNCAQFVLELRWVVDQSWCSIESAHSRTDTQCL